MLLPGIKDEEYEISYKEFCDLINLYNKKWKNLISVKIMKLRIQIFPGQAFSNFIIFF